MHKAEMWDQQILARCYWKFKYLKTYLVFPFPKIVTEINKRI